MTCKPPWSFVHVLSKLPGEGNHSTRVSFAFEVHVWMYQTTLQDVVAWDLIELAYLERVVDRDEVGARIFVWHHVYFSCFYYFSICGGFPWLIGWLLQALADFRWVGFWWLPLACGFRRVLMKGRRGEGQIWCTKGGFSWKKGMILEQLHLWNNKVTTWKRMQCIAQKTRVCHCFNWRQMTRQVLPGAEMLLNIVTLCVARNARSVHVSLKIHKSMLVMSVKLTPL